MMRSINSTRMTTISTTPRPQFTTPRLHGLTIQFPCHHSNATSTHNRSSIKARVSIKIKDYDNLGDFELDSTQLDTLTQLLSLPSFCKEVRTNAGPSKVEGTPEFTGMLFQPVPWSATTRKGMPQVRLVFNAQHNTLASTQQQQ